MYSKVFIAILFVATVTAQLSCSAQWQCSSVTTDYNYVACTNGFCVCRADLGIDGTATVSNPCTCNSPKSITWQNNNPYCVSLTNAVAEDAAVQRCTVLKQKVQQVYFNFRQDIAQYLAFNPLAAANLFSNTSAGKITPLGRFDNSDGNGVFNGAFTRYFYALLASTNETNLNFVELRCDGNTVSSRVDVTVHSASGIPRPIYNYTQQGFFYFKTYFDASGNPFDLIEGAALGILQLSQIQDGPSFLYPIYINKVCGLLNGDPTKNQTQGYCFGANQQYDNYTDCVNFLTSKSFGSWGNAASDTFVCRQLHTIIAAVDPAHHCPHAGKQGGNTMVGFKCINFDYSTWTDPSVNDIVNLWS